ncbi:MAG: cyclic pyranopterin monophosphate synthase MoaC [Deltaproteobacteria bacterium]|nr:cyclic pyranopterin monophosphate synthase MoaC [Candidatus Tharpella aukensis]
MSLLSHLDTRGQAAMVDVGDKPVTRRYARAWGRLLMAPETLALITAQGFAKGDVFGAARLAGIMAAKRTGELIPLCHPLPLSWAGVELIPLFSQSAIIIVAEASLAGQTGIEMEALTAVTIAGLTVYDMCKAVDKSMSLSEVSLLEKKGGRSGHYFAEDRSRLMREVTETELEPENLVFWQSLANGEIEFRLHENGGPFLGKVVSGRGDLLIGAVLNGDAVVVLGEALLRSQPSSKDKIPGSGFLQVLKPGSLEGNALFAVLN